MQALDLRTSVRSKLLFLQGSREVKQSPRLRRATHFVVSLLPNACFASLPGTPAFHERCPLMIAKLDTETSGGKMEDRQAPMKAGWEVWAAIAVLLSALATIAATINDIW